FFFKEKEVCVIGGGDTAMEEALYLTKFAKKVMIIHRRDTFRASRIMQNRVMENSKIEIMWNSQVVEVLGEGKVEGVRVTTSGEVKDMRVDGVFVAIGHKPATSFLEGSGVLLDERGYIYTTERVAFEQKNELLPQFDLRFRYATSV